MNVIITGADGQLGKELQYTAPNHLKIHAYSSESLNITDYISVSTIINQLLPDVVINAAAYTDVDKAESERETSYAVNALGPKNIAKTCRLAGIKLIHISSDYVFNGSSPLPYLPSDQPDPINVYGSSKLQGEHEIIEELENNTIIFRTGWLYSIHGNNFLKTVLKLLHDKDQITIVYDQIGSPTWTRNLATLIWRAVTNFPNVNGVYHWTDAGIASWYDFAIAIQSTAYDLELIKKQARISPIRTNQYHSSALRPANSILDCSSTWQEFDIVPISWQKSLKQMLKSYKLQLNKQKL